jgi:aminopeptidase N
MSSYLVACCIGQFEFVQSTTKRGTLVRVLCTPGKARLCEFALDVGVRSLEFYEDFFDLPYPLPKMDMIGVPDFAMGAMENWGLVTYREIDLLCDPSTVSVARKTRLASVIAHELAHQWFGNLVTMDWWDDLWLNEGFATFMQSYCCDHLFPTWGVWDQYVADDLERALSLDGLRSSHPIQVPIPRAEDVEQVFDAISYCKGASVVRLAFNVLGAQVFRDGLRQYMRHFAFGNTVTSDLWQSLQLAADKSAVKVNVAPLMKSWTEQMGYPVLTVSDDLQVRQSWFVSDGSHQPEDDQKLWQIPLFLNSDKMHALMQAKSEKVTAPALKESWLKFNFGQLAPLRVIYDSPNLLANHTR